MFQLTSILSTGRGYTQPVTKVMRTIHGIVADSLSERMPAPADQIGFFREYSILAMAALTEYERRISLGTVGDFTLPEVVAEGSQATLAARSVLIAVRQQIVTAFASALPDQKQRLELLCWQNAWVDENYQIYVLDTYAGTQAAGAGGAMQAG